MFANYSLSKTREFAVSEAADFIQLADTLHTATDPGKGLITSRQRDRVALSFDGFSPDSGWLEVAARLNGPRWLDSRSFHVRLHATASAEIEISLAIRVHLDGGFRDFIAPDKLRLGPMADWAAADMSPQIWTLQDRTGVDLHLFLPPRDGSIEIHDFDITAIG